MKDIKVKEFVTERLMIKRPTLEEQYALWDILRKEEVNFLYFPTPDRIFIKNNLEKHNLEDAIKARSIFMEQLNDWERQRPFYESKVESINNNEISQRFTWSIFLKTGEVIGQITCQEGETDDLDFRDVGWYIDPAYHGNGYGTEAAETVIDFMFNEVEIKEINTSAAIKNPGSWRIMEKLGFTRTGEKESSYYDETGFIKSYAYKGTKELFNNRPKIKKR